MFSFTDFGQVAVILPVWVRHVAKNNPIKIQEPRIGSGRSCFQ